MHLITLLELMVSEQALLPSDVQPAVKENKPADESESTRDAVNSPLFQQIASEQEDHEMRGEAVTLALMRVGTDWMSRAKEDPMIVDTFDATSATALIESREEEAKFGQELIVSESALEKEKETYPAMKLICSTCHPWRCNVSPRALRRDSYWFSARDLARVRY